MKVIHQRNRSPLWPPFLCGLCAFVVNSSSFAGQPTQVLVAARELNPSQLPQDNWVNRHLAYTHGYGAIVAPANSVTVDGFPSFNLKDLPSPDAIYGIEVFAGPASIPLQYGGSGRDKWCGLVVVWTK